MKIFSPSFILILINVALINGFFGKVYTQGVSLQAKEEKFVRNIEIVRQDVFPEITGKPEFVYEWANKLHIVTKEEIIRRQLLFKSGDVYDQELLEESERNLRRLPYIGKVDIKAIQEESEYVDISVVTQDQWSTILSTFFNRGGGRTTVGASVEEFNLLGFGKQILSEVRHEPEGTTATLNYTDPLLLGSRWTASTSFVTGPITDFVSAQVVRPFFSLDTKLSGGISGFMLDRIDRRFEKGEEVNRFASDITDIRLFGARAIGSRFKKTKLSLTYRFAERVFSPIKGETTDLEEVPEDEKIHSMTVGWSLQNISFVEETQIDKFLRIEDLTLGNITSVRIGRTGFPIPAGVKRFEVGIRRREAHQIFSKQYLITIVGFVTEFQDDRLNDTIASLRLQYYNKLLKHQTVAFNLEFDYGNRLETTRQFLLGGDTGLRGYKAREFSGVKRFLINFEDRIFTSLNVLTVAFGGVVFMDAGNVWDEDERIDLTDLNYSIGFGLRLGYTKSPRSRVGRIDFGWPINRGGGFGVSIGVDQQFSVN